ncbi:hypothetical protein P692DRAFT_20881752 [Suillus brevipes Sb2]|nr:hypothetical protein P692DRAFT_20881752 [Suillus brevipes Sb2]
MTQPPWEKGMTVGLGPPLPTECRPCPEAIRNVRTFCSHFGFESDADAIKTLRNTSSSPHPYLGDCHHILVVPCTCYILVDPILLAIDPTSHALSSFLAAHAAYDSYIQKDVHQLWDGNANLQVRDDFLTRARCGSDRTLRVERILVNTADGAGALSLQTLLYTLQLEGRILQGLLDNGEHDEERLHSDGNISLTATRSEGVTAAGMHVTPPMVLTGRDSTQRNPATPDSAMFLALTYVFPKTDCLRSAGHDCETIKMIAY